MIIYKIFTFSLQSPSVFLDVPEFPMKNITSRDVQTSYMGGATSKLASDVVCLLLGLTSVAYHQDVTANLEIVLFFFTRPCFSGMGRSENYLLNFSDLIPLNFVVNYSNINNTNCTSIP